MSAIAAPGPARRFPGMIEWAAFAGVLAVLWPRQLAVRSDDFGYLESVAETIRRGALAPSDWLEPLNLVLPPLSAALWRIGGSFHAATLGLLGAVALLNFALLWRWLRPALAPGRAGDAAVLALALCPIALNKTVEFTAVPLAFACFLGALLAWRARAAAWFFPLVLLGFLNRQSAVFLLALPAWTQLARLRRSELLEWRWVAGGVATAATIGAVLALVPANFARTLVQQNSVARDPAQVAAQLLLGAGLLGGVAAAWALVRGDTRGAAWRDLRTHGAASVAWLAVGAAATGWLGAGMNFETPWLGRLAPVATIAAFGLAAALPRALAAVEPAAVAASVAYALAVAWRGVWWDYYLCELALLLACARAAPDPGASRRVASWVAAALLVVALAWVFPLWRQLRWAERATVAYEEALRAGRIEVPAMSGAPFGFLGWKVFPAFADSAPVRGERLSDFVKYVEAGRSVFARGAVAVFPPEAERRSIHGSGELRPLPPGYRARTFPLNEAEWRAWLASRQP